jgi:hypothetical protein
MSNSPAKVYHVKRLVQGATGTNTINIMNPLALSVDVKPGEGVELDIDFETEPPMELRVDQDHTEALEVETKFQYDNRSPSGI